MAIYLQCSLHQFISESQALFSFKRRRAFNLQVNLARLCLLSLAVDYYSKLESDSPSHLFINDPAPGDLDAAFCDGKAHGFLVKNYKERLDVGTRMSHFEIIESQPSNRGPHGVTVGQQLIIIMLTCFPKQAINHM